MDAVTKISVGSIFATLVLPAWAVWRLPRYFLSVPIGTMIFWTWSFVGADMIRGIDPEYDSFGPAFNFLFGWVLGGGYCLMWVAIREFLSWSRRQEPRTLSGYTERFHNGAGLAMWAAVAGVCIAMPFLHRVVYRQSGLYYLLTYICTGGPILLLAMTMVIAYLLRVLRQEIPAAEPALPAEHGWTKRLCGDHKRDHMTEDRP